MKRAAVQLLDAGLLPIPALQKRPKYSHKPLPQNQPGGGVPRWTRELAQKQLHLFDECNEIGVLVTNNLLVVDFDTEKIYESWYAEFKELFDATSLVKTKHGYHVYLRRTAYCNEKRVHDGPIGFFWNEATQKKEKKPVDIKTISASTSFVTGADGKVSVYHTPGFVSTPPSLGKAWVRSVFDCPPVDITDALVDRILTERGAFSSVAPHVKPARAEAAHVTPPCDAEREPDAHAAELAAEEQAPASQGFTWKPVFERDKPCLESMGFTNFQNVMTFHSCNAKSKERGYVTGGYEFQSTGRCPCCQKPDGHGNFYFVMYRAEGNRRILNYSGNCLPTTYGKQLHTMIPIPWTETGRANWLAALQTGAAPLAAQHLARLGAVCPLAARALSGWTTPLAVNLVQPGGAVVRVSLKVADSVLGCATYSVSSAPWSLLSWCPAVPLPVTCHALHAALATK